MRGSKCLLTIISATSAGDYSPYDTHYAQGIHAYENENWTEAITEFERAIEERNRYLEAKVHCSIDSCGNITGDSLKSLSIGSGFSQYVIARGLCLYKCMSEAIGKKYVDWRILPSVDEEFQARLPYQYLNVAYFKSGNIRKAVETAFTFFNADPSDPEMQDTLAFYQEMEEVDDSMFVDIENPEHLKHYEIAQSVYQLEDYPQAISEFEQSLHWYWDSMDECRALCDAPFDFGDDYPDELPNYHLFQTKMVAQLLECRLKCVKQMELPCGRYHRRSNSDLLPIHYHYLMFAYHEIGDDPKAASMAKTYLTFHPDNEPMQINIQFFDQEVYEAAQPEEKAVKFHKKLMREVKMLEYLEHHFGPTYGFKYDYVLLTPFPDEMFFEAEDERLMNEDIGDIDENSQTPWDPENEVKDPPTFGPSYDTPFPTGAEIGYESVAEKIDDLLFDPLAEPDKVKQVDTVHGKLPYYSAGDEKFGYVVRDSPKYTVFDDGPAVDAEGPVADGAVLKQNSTHLAGPTRFVMDGLLSDEQCESLYKLASYGIVGDGYEGDKKPHLKGEEFAGISLLTAARLADIGAVETAAVQLYHDINFKLAKIVKEYFKLETDLYIDFIHLVCRDPKDEKTTDEDGNIILSHPVHPDNCLYLPDGTCPRRPPAYVWREYSAVLYLNEDIEGGEIFFADPSGKYALAGVKPKCGRLVGFCAGTDCLHGVKKLTGGKRCALPIWYTTRKEKEDFTLEDARAILKRLNSSSASNTDSDSSEKMPSEKTEL